MARVVRAVCVRRQVSRRSRPLTAHARVPHVRSDRRARRRADHVAARDASAARATGTIATAGCGTRRSRWMRCCTAGTATKRRGSANGCCARSRAIPRACRSCTASAGNDASPSSRSTGCRAGTNPVPCASATRRTSRRSSMCTASSPTSCGSASARGSRSTTTRGSCSWCCSSRSRRSGGNPTTASGRCAARAATSCTRRSLRGSRSIARSRWSRPPRTAARVR